MVAYISGYLLPCSPPNGVTFTAPASIALAASDSVAVDNLNCVRLISSETLIATAIQSTGTTTHATRLRANAGAPTYGA
jgi:hypothetical protein